MNVSVSLSWRWTDEWVLSFCRAARGDPASRVLNQHAVGVVLGLTGAHWRPPQSGGRQRATVSPRWASWTSRQTWGADRGAISLEAKPDTHQASGYNISSTVAPNQSHWNKNLSSSSESARKLMNKENLLRFASLSFQRVQSIKRWQIQEWSRGPHRHHKASFVFRCVRTNSAPVWKWSCSLPAAQPPAR